MDSISLPSPSLCPSHTKDALLSSLVAHPPPSRPLQLLSRRPAFLVPTRTGDDANDEGATTTAGRGGHSKGSAWGAEGKQHKVSTARRLPFPYHADTGRYLKVRPAALVHHPARRLFSAPTVSPTQPRSLSAAGTISTRGTRSALLERPVSVAVALFLPLVLAGLGARLLQRPPV